MLRYCHSFCQSVGCDSGSHNSGWYFTQQRKSQNVPILFKKIMFLTIWNNKIMLLSIWNNKIIFVLYLCCYFARTTNTCTNIITLQYHLDIYILGSNTAWRGVGGWVSCSETLPYSKFCHISWEQMMTEHRGLSVYISIFFIFFADLSLSFLCLMSLFQLQWGQCMQICIVGYKIIELKHGGTGWKWRSDGSVYGCNRQSKGVFDHWY